MKERKMPKFNANSTESPGSRFEEMMKMMADLSAKMGKQDKAEEYLGKWEDAKNMRLMLEEEDEDKYCASQDECFDGLWSIAGMNGMLIHLDSPDFLGEERLEFDEDNGDGQLVFDEEFFVLPSKKQVMKQPQVLWDELRRRNLSVASGVLRRWFFHDSCPPRIRIKRWDEPSMANILDMKKKGNMAFGAKKYEKAARLYEQSLIHWPDHMYVGPTDQMQEIVNILSNKAECELRLHQYDDAGFTATDALVFDKNHEKSRIRRAKAELAIGKQEGSTYFVQAQVDLQHVLDNDSGTSTDAGQKTARSILEEVERHLRREKEMFQEKNPDSDWELFVRLIKVKCF